MYAVHTLCLVDFTVSAHVFIVEIDVDPQDYFAPASIIIAVTTASKVFRQFIVLFIGSSITREFFGNVSRIKHLTTTLQCPSETRTEIKSNLATAKSTKRSHAEDVTLQWTLRFPRNLSAAKACV
uniref:Uncharacterized protein n=1 Tax=Glossina austeni TaxID=7395 RepID=A0A1A9UPR0_GLOAU